METQVTETLIDQFYKSEKPFRFSYELSSLLEKFHDPDLTLSLDESKRLQEYRKYFNWDEEYSVNYDQIIDPASRPQGYLKVDSLSELMEVVESPEDYEWDDRMDDYFHSVQCDDIGFEVDSRSYSGIEVGVRKFKPKNLYLKPITQEDLKNVLDSFFIRMDKESKLTLFRSERNELIDTFDEIINDWGVQNFDINS